jgi:hypothetical protein
MLNLVGVLVLTALVRKSRCAFVNGFLTGAGLVAASGPAFGVRDGLGVASLSELWLIVEPTDEALRDPDTHRIGRVLRARLGTRKSSTGKRHGVSRFGKDIVTFESPPYNKKDKVRRLVSHRFHRVPTLNEDVLEFWHRQLR